MKTHGLQLASKNFNTTRGFQKRPVCTKGTRLIRFPGMEAFNDALTFEIGYPSSLGSSFVIEIQTHAKIGLERIC